MNTAFFSVLSLTLVMVLAACRNSEATPPAVLPPPAVHAAQGAAGSVEHVNPGDRGFGAAPGENAGKQFTVAASPLQLKVGAAGTLTVTIKPAKGLHFNKEFPAKFSVDANPNVRSGKEKLTAKDGDVKVIGVDGVVAVPLTGVTAGQTTVRVVGNFSVCSDEQCYMLRNEALSATVTVK